MEAMLSSQVSWLGKKGSGCVQVGAKLTDLSKAAGTLWINRKGSCGLDDLVMG